MYSRGGGLLEGWSPEGRQVWELNVFYQPAGISLHSTNAAGNFCGTATGILASHPLVREDRALIISFILCPLCPYTASEHGRGIGRSSARQTDGNGAKTTLFRQSGKLLPALTFRHQKGKTSRVLGRGKRSSSYQCRDRAAVNENCLIGEKKVREEAWWPGLSCRAERSRVVQLLLSAGASHLHPAGHVVPRPDLHAKMLLDSFPTIFTSHKITRMFPTGNHGKGVRGLPALR